MRGAGSTAAVPVGGSLFTKVSGAGGRMLFKPLEGEVRGSVGQARREGQIGRTTLMIFSIGILFMQLSGTTKFVPFQPSSDSGAEARLEGGERGSGKNSWEAAGTIQAKVTVPRSKPVVVEEKWMSP